MREVVVKRYNMVRQAVEIYFEDSKSVFISFFSSFYLAKFVNNLRKIVGKKPTAHLEIVERQAQHFSEKGYRGRWVRGELSNFQYLMLLNKYSGRSFNDITQYPVFPWILKEYSKQSISLSDPSIYRNLMLPIAAITKEKQRLAEDSGKSASGAQGQAHKTHYLPAGAVLGYMFRIEPFSSLLKGAEQQRQVKGRLFNVVGEDWAKCQSDPQTNKELIPQFYYFSPMFANYNKYSFEFCHCGIKDSAATKRASLAAISHVDRVELPAWARSTHHFVQQNALALESPYVSQNLDKWIDLVFGDRQQDPRAYNQFREISDESTMTGRYERFSKEQVAEMHEYGSNPIKMFADKHPQMNVPEYLKRTQYTIFNCYVKEEDRLFALLRMNSFHQPIVYISAYETRATVLLNNGHAMRTKEEYINVPHEKLLSFEKRETVLFPSVRTYDESLRALVCDAQRTVVPIDNGALLATCRHYDCSWKITLFASGEVVSHVYFHKVSPI